MALGDLIEYGDVVVVHAEQSVRRAADNHTRALPVDISESLIFPDVGAMRESLGGLQSSSTQTFGDTRTQVPSSFFACRLGDC